MDKGIEQESDFGFGVYDERFQNPLVAADYLESLRWPDAPVCPHCGVVDEKHYRLKSQTRRLWKCRACRKQFTVTVGTIFEGSHIPLNKWLLAFYLLCSSKKGMSAHQLHRMLGVTYKSAWFMAHRIRYAMEQPAFQERLTGVVEVDETYIGGKVRRSNKRQTRPLDPTKPDKRMQTGRGADKTPVVALVERGGIVRAERVANVTGKELKGAIGRHVDPSATLMTDSFASYRSGFDTRNDSPLLARSRPALSAKKKPAKRRSDRLKIDLPFEEAVEAALHVQPEQSRSAGRDHPPPKRARHRESRRSE